MAAPNFLECLGPPTCQAAPRLNAQLTLCTRCSRGQSADEAIPAWIANLTRPGRLSMPSLSIMRMRGVSTVLALIPSASAICFVLWRSASSLVSSNSRRLSKSLSTAAVHEALATPSARQLLTTDERADSYYLSPSQRSLAQAATDANCHGTCQPALSPGWAFRSHNAPQLFHPLVLQIGAYQQTTERMADEMHPPRAAGTALVVGDCSHRRRGICSDGIIKSVKVCQEFQPRGLIGAPGHPPMFLSLPRSS